MCGIAGLMPRDGGTPEDAVLDALAAALRHRGPDGGGRHVAPGLGLVQTRLAIIDLETGGQPLFGPGGTVLVANGEIYNYLELREQFPEAAFNTHSDCEPPLWLYGRDGLDFVDSLRGMYAMALYDPLRRRLLLARDPFGIKPLYYAETAAGFGFASEPQALIKAGLVAARMRGAARDELLQLQFTTGGETIFEGIRRVLPGETLVVEAGVVVERRRRAALPVGGPRRDRARTALQEIDTVLRDSVMVHQRSDVPYGMFLSGGVDSSALLALMRDLNDTPVQALTAGFSGTGAVDEREHACRVAVAAGAEVEAVDFSERDFWSLLPAIATAMDDPAADYAVLPTYKLAEKARERGIKVVLSGEGGDEMFAGYGRYRRLRRPGLLGGRPARKRGAMDGLDLLRAPPAGWRDGIAAAERAALGFGRTRLQVAQAVDCADWLAHDLLGKLDRCLMAHGVEGRTPFLDPEVADRAFRLADGLKIRGRSGKWLLRRWLDGVLPEANAFSRKRGFSVPVGEWIAARGGQLAPLVAAQQGVAEACHGQAVEGLFAALGAKNKGPAKHQEKAAWHLLFFALWHEIHIIGAPPDSRLLDAFS